MKGESPSGRGRLGRVQVVHHRAVAAGLSTLPHERLGSVLWAATHGLVALRRAGKVDEAAFETVLADLREVLAFGFVPRGKTP